MAHRNTVFVQLLRFLPRHEFDAEARQHQRGQGLRVMSRWAQFVALGLAQLTGRQSLRDIVSNLSTQGRKLYHLGVGTTVSRSSLARVNAEQPYTLYETLFGRLLSRCQQCAPRHGFRFKNKLYAVDATTIDLCLAVFPWASFRRTKAAIKLHIGLDQAGHLPSFVSVTEGKTGDVKAARTWTFPAGSVVVDRAYLDFKWFHQLQARGVTFVTRLKRGVRYRVTREHDIRPGTGVLSDLTWSRWFGQLEGLVKVYSDCEITPSSSSAPALTGGCHGWHEAGSYPVIDDDDALWNCGNLAAGAQAWAAALAREISNGLWAPASPPSGFSATVSGRPQAGQVHIAGWDMVLGLLMR